MHVPTVAAENAVITAASEAITTEVAKQHVSALADDTFEGRAAGTRGGRAAGLYVVKDLQAHGLKGAGLKRLLPAVRWRPEQHSGRARRK